MTKKISQREARRLKARVYQLEHTFKSWSSTWFSGATHLHSIIPSEKFLHIVRTATALDHPVLVKADGDELKIYGVTLK